MSVEPRPPLMTSAPWEAAPRPSACASGPDEVRMSCSVTSAFVPVSLTNAAPTASATVSSSSSGTTPLMSYAKKILSRSLTSARFLIPSATNFPGTTYRSRAKQAVLGLGLGGGSGAEHAQMAAAANLDALANRLGRARQRGTVRRGGWPLAAKALGAISMIRALGALGAIGFADH